MLKDRVAIVTGAARGIGRTIVDCFASRGAKIVVADLVEEEAEEVIRQLKTKNIECLGVKANVTQIDEVKYVVEKTISKFGRIDILVNNAGGGSPLRSIEEIEIDEWDRIIRNNLTSTYICCKAVVPHMKKQKCGKIINISSIAGRFFSPLSGPHYASAKAGIQGLTRQLAKELGPFNITVNAVAPGTTLTQRVEKKWLTHSEEDRKQLLSMIPLGRLAQPEDIADAVLFFASDLSNYITGVTLDVNGGFFMS
ncbi:short-chain dehydrogenase [Candidatus Atribacteria bacterium HGW-Atribacteria-1]|nr:MAG: short-chain dehydrogenase [Candidatus Atribacteria bacterium HGW-Atribacteria-1]